ncbi:MAG TPA: M14 family zinc carboxypeptidase, partial [Actinomycetota bacterium]
FEQVNDGTGDEDDACEPLVGFTAGNIAIAERGACNFTQKTLNAQAAGSIALVIYNNVGGSPFSPGGSAPGITIPTVMVSQDDGNTILAGLPATGTLIPSEGISNNQRVGVDSIAWGHEGGNDLTIASVDPGAADSPLSVDVSGDDITVNLGTDAGGALSSTAADVVAAINGDSEASALVFAYTYRGSSGSGIAQPAPRRNLSDFLSAPASVPRDPRTVKLLRIGKHRDGSRPGVFAYAQEHAREWVPPLVAIETAERLLRNYEDHGPTKQLVNRLDIFILPSTNPDGGEYSFYDDNGQRRNMTRHCDVDGAYDLNARDNWGVDNNRNYDEYSLFDGYSGASTNCQSDVFAGPAELSEPESANIDWVADEFENIKFSMNLHSSGNYFMWSPGSYAMPGRVSAPRPSLAEESFFWGASSRILTEIKQHRGLSVTPARTGPISDVLYSAAGNSGDMLWYKYGIYAWNFEVGTSFQPPFENPNPNGGSAHAESQEFANGLMELMRVAHDFDRDHERPESWIEVTPSATPGMVNVVFETTEPAAVFYETDGSTPTYDSTLYASGGIREAGELLTVAEGTVFHFFSVDAAGNVENNYIPDGTRKNFNKATAVIGG